jgi:hypothetical protein
VAAAAPGSPRSLGGATREPDGTRPPLGRRAARPAGAASAAGPDAATLVPPASGAADAAEAPSEPSALDDREVVTAAEDGIATALAGAFYLVNVVRRLGPALPEALEGWDLVDGLARGLLCDADDGDGDPVHDALWAALAELAGRDPGAPIGRAAAPCGDRGVPADWRTAAGVALDAGRLDGALAAPLSACARSGLELAVPALRVWLARELDVAPGLVTAELIRCPGRVHVTRTHVDVVMALAAVSLPIRRAGLDADPGWVPGLARVVRFHFD